MHSLRRESVPLLCRMHFISWVGDFPEMGVDSVKIVYVFHLNDFFLGVNTTNATKTKGNRAIEGRLFLTHFRSFGKWVKILNPSRIDIFPLLSSRLVRITQTRPSTQWDHHHYNAIQPMQFNQCHRNNHLSISFNSLRIKFNVASFAIVAIHRRIECYPFRGIIIDNTTCWSTQTCTSSSSPPSSSSSSSCNINAK